MFGEHRVMKFVSLHAGRLHRRAPAPVQQTILNHRCVRKAAHLAAERVYFADDVSLGNAADGGVAGEFADGVEGLRDKQG